MTTAVLKKDLSVVRSNRRGSVLQVVLNRPEKRNAFSPEVIEELIEVFSEKVHEDGLRLVHLSGAGPAFCAGADLQWMAASRHLSDEENRRDADRLFRMYKAMQSAPIPIVTQVHGAVFGSGIGLCSASDIVIADTSSRFSLSETRRGLIPAVMMPFVLEKIGESRTRELLITGREFGAQEAKEFGLAHFVCSENDRDAVANRVLEDIIQSAPRAIEESCRLIELCRDLSFAALRHDLVSSLAQTRAGQEAQEGLSAFFEKRQPAWSQGSWSLEKV